MDFLIIATAFSLGIASSLHCLGMCGPLVMAVPFPKLKNREVTKVLYFMGKALAYVVLGALIGILGLKSIWGNAQQYVSIFSGVLLILLSLLPFLKQNIKFGIVQSRLTFVLQNMQVQPKARYFLQLGFLNGLLPCGMVYIALTTALASGSPLNGSLAMLAFGLGTTPVLWGVTLFKQKLGLHLRAKLKQVQLVLSLAVGLLLVLRGLGLGIPYISPTVASTEQGKISCCTPAKK